MNYRFFLLYIYILFLTINVVKSQENKKKYIKTGQYSWENFVNKIENQFGINIFYNPDSITDFEFTLNQDSVELYSLLNDLFKKFNFNVSSDLNNNIFIFKHFKIQNQQTFIVYKNKNDAKIKKTGTDNDNKFLENYKDLITDYKVIGLKKNKPVNGKVELSGYILNSDDKTTIPQARIKIEETNQNIITNFDGFYRVSLKPASYTITASSLGMEDEKYKLTVYEDGEFNIELNTKAFLIDEAVITANYKNKVKSTLMGFEKIDAKSIKKLPVVLGEQDIVKVALMLPGVQTVGEVSSGFNVRGSPADQNMFYINSVPIYNTSHLFGLYTTFNSDAINGYSFYKSNVPVEYGGHLSSIFEIDSKVGNKNKFSSRGGISPLSSRILIEGPILNDSSQNSFLISLRSTYSDWLLNQIDNVNINHSSASFYDGLIDFTFNINEKNNIDIFFYGSEDEANLAFGLYNKYRNIGGSINWMHIYNEEFMSELNIVKGQYNYDIENFDIPYLGYSNSFYLKHDELKFKLHYNPNENHDLLFGINTKLYQIEYGDLLPLNNESYIKSVDFESEKASVSSVFLSDRWDVNESFGIEAGLRASYYAFLGPKTVYSYKANMKRDYSNIMDSTRFSKNDIVSDDINIDFRLSAKYELNSNFSIKASYNILHQYISMLSNTVSVSPTNKWKLSDSHLKPLKGQQLSFGLYNLFEKGKIETSVEMYYKTVQNQYEYKDGAELLYSRLPETDIIQGDINAYGIEVMIKKNEGQLNGWLNYTYSRSMVKAIDNYTGEMNNNGMKYPANFDKPHAFNLVLNYKLSKRISLSTNLVYSSGRPVTYPTSIYRLNNVEIIGFSERNEYRLPDYFRMDLSINIEGNLKKHKFSHSTWAFGVYNLTSRKNPYSIMFQNEDGVIKGYKISILGKMIPSITYNIKLGHYEN